MLQLRPDVSIAQLRPEHAARVYRWMCDPAVAAGVGLRSAPSLERTIAWIQHSANEPLISAFAVLVDQQHVGNVVLDKTDLYLKTSRLSVYIGESQVRGSGVGLTGIYRALLEGFRKHDLHKVWLTVHANNQAAIRTYLKLNFKVEGVLRDEFWLEGRRVDAYYMGLLSSEFEALSREGTELVRGVSSKPL